MPDTAGSKWISHTADESTGPEAPGDYTYQTSFTVSGDPNSVSVSGQIEIDSVLKAVVINGHAIANPPSANFGSWTSFSISGGFVSGTNVVQFVVTRVGTTNNPSAFRCEMNGAAGRGTQGVISNLYNTGLNVSDGSADAHYTLVSIPGGASSSVYATLQKYPIQSGLWMLDTAASKWISHTPDESTGPETPGDYTYQTSFTVSGDPSSVSIDGRVAFDSVLKSMTINGVTVLTNVTTGFSSWTPFRIASALVSGTNTLQFVVTRVGTTNNPSGFRCEMAASILPHDFPLPAWAQGATPVDSGGAEWTQFRRCGVPGVGRVREPSGRRPGCA